MVSCSVIKAQVIFEMLVLIADQLAIISQLRREDHL